MFLFSYNGLLIPLYVLTMIEKDNSNEYAEKLLK